MRKFSTILFLDSFQILWRSQVYFNADDFKVRFKTLRHHDFENIIGTLEPFVGNPQAAGPAILSKI